MKYSGLLFDLDGTLWDATENIRKSWNIAIQDFDELKGTEISLKQLQSVRDFQWMNCMQNSFHPL